MPTTAAPVAAAPTSVPVRHLLDLHIDFEPVPHFATPRGRRMLLAARSGHFEGPDLRGTVLPGSADWLTIGSDLVAHIDVRAVLRTDDGEHLYLSNTGRVSLGEHGPRFLAGERVTAAQAYIRTHPLFETAAPRLAHLGALTTVAYCDISLTAIDYRIHAVL